MTPADTEMTGPDIESEVESTGGAPVPSEPDLPPV
jgi:hypothetical protein